MNWEAMLVRSFALASILVFMPAIAGTLPDHEEFDAALHVPFTGFGVRPITLQFSYPGASAGTPVAWEVALLGSDGLVKRDLQRHTTMSAAASTQVALGRARSQWSDAASRVLHGAHARHRVGQ